MSITDQIEKAKVEVRKMKRAVPYIFNEYSELLASKRNLREARERYSRAKEVWKNLAK